MENKKELMKIPISKNKAAKTAGLYSAMIREVVLYDHDSTWREVQWKLTSTYSEADRTM